MIVSIYFVRYLSFVLLVLKTNLIKVNNMILWKVTD